MLQVQRHFPTLSRPRKLGIHRERLLTLLLLEAQRAWPSKTTDNIGAKPTMARDYLNLPTMLDALEDEMDLEAAAVAKEARATQERGLSEIKRAHVAIQTKNSALDRLKAFADNMEARNTSNGGPKDGKLDPTSGDGSPQNSTAVGARPSETAQLGAVKGV